MDFGTAISTCFSKYAVFSGRARRSEYWFFFLFCMLVNFGTNLVQGIITAAAHVPVPIAGIVSLGLFLPQLAVGVRRLHDVDWSGWWLGAGYLLSFVMLAVWVVDALQPRSDFTQLFSSPVGVTAILLTAGAIGYGIMLFVLTVLSGTPGTNNFGPDPKAPNVDVF
jgi:uncharacterized membrane protein YhaH (DUF805 family)